MSACVPAGSANLAQNNSARPTITGTEQERSTLPAPTLSKVINSTPILEPVTTLAETALEPTVSPALEICSPLEDISLAELPQPDLLKNPFQPPRPGMDDGHHGVDFAYWSRGERKTMLGLPVLSVLAGQVAGIILNRQPYGYAIIIETPLDGFPAAGPVNVNLPTPAPTVQPASSLFCPTGSPVSTGGPNRSLYLLYAHLNKAPSVTAGEQVQCGQPMGEIGTTGKSVNPHLHLETRIGPAGSIFPAVAHYENDASPEEMQAYCTWRVSGLFQMFDPLSLLHRDTLQP